MALLPSNLHFCIHSGPLDSLLQNAQAGCGPWLAEILSIQEPDDLRPWMQLRWMLPLGADCAVDSPLHVLSEPAPPGLTLIDSGHSMDQPPAHLDPLDLEALDIFWKSRRCRHYLELLMARVREVHQLLLHSQAPEDRFLVEWFGISPSASESLRTLQDAEAAERDTPFTPNPCP